MENYNPFPDDELLTALPKVRGKYTLHAPLANKVWFRVGGPAQVSFKPADMADLTLFLKEKPADISLTTLGVGSNVLIRDGGIAGIVTRLGRSFSHIVINGDQIDVGAALLDRTVAMVACEEGLSGLEFLAGIPGTIGGALRMNAGCYGSEIKDVLIAAFALDPQGQLHHLTVNDLGFGYRKCGLPDDWIFIGARFQCRTGNRDHIAAHIENLLKERENAQPVRTRTGGSTFANPLNGSAWKLVDQAGCRGLSIGGAQMSEKHCNFMINTGQATAHDLEKLGEEVRQRVLETSGVLLEWEIRRLGHAGTGQEKRILAA